MGCWPRHPLLFFLRYFSASQRATRCHVAQQPTEASCLASPHVTSQQRPQQYKHETLDCSEVLWLQAAHVFLVAFPDHCDILSLLNALAPEQEAACAAASTAAGVKQA